MFMLTKMDEGYIFAGRISIKKNTVKYSRIQRNTVGQDDMFILTKMDEGCTPVGRVSIKKNTVKYREIQ
jgi:hypothetical protein